MPALIDLTGNKYGRLTVISRAKNIGRSVAWNCKCDCGVEKVINGCSLKKGATKSCGCLQSENRSKRKIDETGNRYGKLVVIKESKTKDRMINWDCKCDCGNSVSVRGTSLRSGQTKSCGCLRKEGVVQEIGNKYGELTVIYRDENKESKEAFWVCNCSCGNKVSVSGHHLRNGNTKSCGCVNSWAEKHIAKILREKNIRFKQQYCFDDLRGLKGGLLRFDFAIFKNGELSHLIEYDGKQHTDKTSLFYKEDTAEHDRRKNEYCKANNIRLLRFSDGYSNITVDDLL